jgi:hypothetical protein
MTVDAADHAGVTQNDTQLQIAREGLTGEIGPADEGTLASAAMTSA